MILHDLNITAPWQRFYNPKHTRKGSKIFLETLADLEKVEINFWSEKSIFCGRKGCDAGAFRTVLLTQVFGINPAIL